MASSSTKKSTRVLLIRALLRAAEVVAPGGGARFAERLWFTLPPAPRTTDLPTGGEPFEVTSEGTTIRGVAWGEGQAVYLVHGWGGRGSQLAAYVEPLLERGHRVVLFDGPSHGDSDAGPSGPRSSTGVELGKALDAVAARFGPAAAVIAHSMGTVSTLLAMKYGWLASDRLVLVAPMVRVSSHLDGLQRLLGIGRRTRRLLEQRAGRRVGVPVEEFDLEVLASDVLPGPTLVVHDVGDRETSYDEAAKLAAGLPDGRLVTTHGLGHRRILRDPEVVAVVAAFVAGVEPGIGELRATA